MTPSQQKVFERLQEALKSKNVRVTNVRLEILKIITTHEHPTINDIISELEKSSHKVNVMSVYNTLDMLLDKHIIYANIFNGKQICYEPKVQESYHLKCDQCQKVHHLENFGQFLPSFAKTSELYG